MERAAPGFSAPESIREDCAPPLMVENGARRLKKREHQASIMSNLKTEMDRDILSSSLFYIALTIFEADPILM